ncbi:MAG: hypothetical protein HYU71_10415 [Bacteroidetes bacterium]|nr:hypothetical protein [Bacteroidota bacterium]
MAGVSVLHPAGLVAVVPLANIAVQEAHAVFVQHQKSQRKNPLKEVVNARQLPKRERSVVELLSQDPVTAGSMQNEWVRIFIRCK